MAEAGLPLLRFWVAMISALSDPRAGRALRQTQDKQAWPLQMYMGWFYFLLRGILLALAFFEIGYTFL